MSHLVKTVRVRAWHISFAVRVLFCSVIAAGAHALSIENAAAQTLATPRTRVSLNAGWRFQRDDPRGSEGQLSYEQIKGWLNATGNEFTTNADAAARPRPAGNLGAGVTYAQRGFDDSAWRRLDLPHDWGIEGPFNQDYPGETGKLPWWGVGWYRKQLTIPAGAEASVSISTSTGRWLMRRSG